MSFEALILGAAAFYLLTRKRGQRGSAGTVPPVTAATMPLPIDDTPTFDTKGTPVEKPPVLPFEKAYTK